MANKKLLSVKRGKQLSVFVENRPGSLAKVIDLLRENGVNMLALSLSEGLELGYLRIIADRSDEAKNVLYKNGHLVFDRDVILLEVINQPGGLAAPIDILAKAGVNLDYAYCASGSTPDRSLIVVRPDDMEKAMKVLANE